MFNFFKKRLDAKQIFFTLNKHLLSSIYELREFPNSRPPISSTRTVNIESTALVYFLIAGPIQLSELPSLIKKFLLSALKGCAMAHVTEFEKNESQQIIESRFDEYYHILETGYNEAEICSKYLDFLGIVDHENDIIQNFKYTSFIDNLFMFSMEIIGTANKDSKIIYTALSKEDWASISAQSQQAVSEYNKKRNKERVILTRLRASNSLIRRTF
ncbi:hypothetical protein HN615_06170 [Candidatus Woesearchaeota archaeon]|jgi:hypothetical protein|nr:hypothetical protein [Candidatus Woesearchaeota archaeon]